MGGTIGSINTNKRRASQTYQSIPLAPMHSTPSQKMQQCPFYNRISHFCVKELFLFYDFFSLSKILVFLGFSYHRFIYFFLDFVSFLKIPKIPQAATRNVKIRIIPKRS